MSTTTRETKSLKAKGSSLANSGEQIRLLSGQLALPRFEDQLAASGLFPLLPTGVEILQVNVGKMCNQVCKHCHVDAGPDRREIMTRETMQLCLDALDASSISTVDLTGGAPEMNPHFRWFVEEITRRGRKVLVRCNLTIILANPQYHDLPQFFRQHQVEVVSSLPFYNKRRTDSQRGDGVFDKSIEALRMLNAQGYGVEGSGLVLNLVFNPAGAFLSGDQSALEKEYKHNLYRDFGIVFNNLYTITNLPISRFLDYLLASNNYESYMERLVSSYNPVAAAGVMCRNTISVGWDGYLYDCDFNQMLDLRVEQRAPQHLSDWNLAQLNKREIVVNQHCYGCTAGAGSSCGGATA